MAETFAMTPLARAQLLGGLRLFAANGAAVPITSRRARAVLAVVCLEGDTGVLRDRLCGLLWGDRAEEQARASLRQCLFELKAALGDLSEGLLDVDRERIAIRPGVLVSDVAQLRRLLKDADAAQLVAVSPLLASGQLLEGLEFPGLFQDWLVQSRGAFEAALTADLGGCLSRLEGEGRWDEMVTLAEAYLRRDPLHEGFVAAAIRAERASGQHVAAQKRFLAAKRLLSKELGVEPSPILVEAANGDLSSTVATASSARIEIETPVADVGVADSLLGARPRIGVPAFAHADDPEQADFAEALAEDLISGLSRSPLLAVTPRESSLGYDALGQKGDVCDGSANRSSIRTPDYRFADCEGHIQATIAPTPSPRTRTCGSWRIAGL